MGNTTGIQNFKVGVMGRLREDLKMYKLVDMHGGGELIPWMRYKERTGDDSFIESYIDVKVGEFLYNQGKGKLIAITDLVKARNKERNEHLGAFSRKKGKGKSGPNILDDFNQENVNAGDLNKGMPLKLLDGGGKGGKGESKYREITWKTDERGSMGETLVGVCLLQGTDIHNKLAIRLLDAYPKLVNDISLSEDYYGMSPLHQAIVNQDVRMVAVLLKRGANVNTRCYGAFFCADDQIESRTDSLEHENVDLSPKTNYTGTMYFGEYPLSFAACMNHPDCFRLLIAYKANPNAQDTNGNTVLHMCVIHEHRAMFRLAVEKGAKLNIANNQKLTPLTLAAKLAKKKMFLEILSLEGDYIWEYGNASQISYPLCKIDSVNEENGDMNDESALSLVVYGETTAHLELLDGILEDILTCKWNAYGMKNWSKSFGFFIVYYIFFFGAYMTRPFSLTTEDITLGMIGMDGYNNNSANDYIYENPDTGVNFTAAQTQCNLRDYQSLPFFNGYFRLGCEAVVIVLIIAQIASDWKDIHRIGWRKWRKIYIAFPAKISYKLAFFLVLLVIPVRVLCGTSDSLLVVDNVLSMIAVIMTTVHFLYFCRAIKFVGPFVLMIYTIIAKDIARFVLIYSVFLIGFSQSFYVVFGVCEDQADLLVSQNGSTYFQNVLSSPADALLRTFIMTVGEFKVFYQDLAECPAPFIQTIGKIVFVGFELCVSILQINMLIAMMTSTYHTIFNTRREWMRQWAQVILMLELSLSPQERLHAMHSYTRPTGTNRTKRSFVVRKKYEDDKMEEFEKQALREKEEMIREEKRVLARRKKLETDVATRPFTAWRLRREELKEEEEGEVDDFGGYTDRESRAETRQSNFDFY